MSNLDFENTNPINEPFLGEKGSLYSSVRFFEITSRTELLEWIEDNKSVSLLEQTQKERDENKTFRDKNGILRYSQNWLPAPDGVISPYESIYEQFYFETGCGEISFLLHASHLKSRRECKDNVAALKILLDWERLWWHFSTDSTDELAIHSFLLRASLGFFLHQRTMILLLFLELYSTVVQIWYLSYFPDTYFGLLLLVLYNLVSSFLYVILRRLYVGTAINSGRNPGEQENLLRQQSDRALNRTAPNMHWIGSIRRFVMIMYLELVLLLTKNPCARQPSSRIGHSKRQVATSFEDLLNIALKYLTQHCGVGSHQLNLNRRVYKLAFLSLFTILPGYCVLTTVPQWQTVISVCSQLGPDNIICKNTIISMVLTVGSLVPALILYLLYGTLIVSIIGLTIGTELAYHMTDWWIRRFVGLRKVAVQSVEYEGKLSRPDASVVQENAITARETIQDRPASVINEDQRLSLLDLEKYLKTDAVEQYLFLVEYMRQCGVIWSAVIVGLYLYAIIMGLISVYQCVVYILYPSPTSNSSDTIFQHTLFVLPFICQFLLFSVFPTVSLAHANSLIAPLLEMFSNSAREDFSIIGIYAC